MSKQEEHTDKTCTTCKKNLARPHWDNGLYCGDDQCDECVEKMRQECRSRSW